MENYITSSKVKAFPAAGRSDTYSESYLLSEKNLTEVIRSLYQKNKSGFIISQEFEAPFKFVIDGRYFELSDISQLKTFGDLFATIFVNKETNRIVGYDPTNTVNKFIDNILDDDSKFIGIYFSSDEPVDDPANNYLRYSLQILKDGKLYKDNIIRLVTDIVTDVQESGNDITRKRTLVLNTKIANE